MLCILNLNLFVVDLYVVVFVNLEYSMDLFCVDMTGISNMVINRKEVLDEIF